MVLRVALVLWFATAAAARGRAEALSTEPGSSPLRQGTNVQTLAAYKQMSLEELMNLDVTSVSKTPEPYGQAPAAIQVITSDEIRRFGASSIPEALRLADNLDVAQASSLSWDISARGFNSSVGNKLLVLMDGRTVYTPLLSGVIWNVQDYLLEDLDRIEVISGPGGTLWGANAVNGVINIVSKNAKDTQGFYAEAGGGTFLEDFVGVRYGGTLASNVYFRVYGKYFDRGSEVFTNGADAGDSWNRGQGGFRIDAEASTQNLFTLQGDVYGGNTHVRPGGVGTPEADGRASGGNLLGRWSHIFSEDSDLNVQMYYDRTHLAAPFQSFSTLIPAGTLFDDLDTFDLQFQHRFLWGNRQQIIWGGEYRFTHDVVGEAPLVAFLPPTLDQNLYSGFLQDEIKLRERLFLTLGSKLEHYDYTGFEVEPNGRLRWDITDRQMLWGAVSRAVRTPARYDHDLYEPNPNYFLLLAGNSNFVSETVVAYELGYRAQLGQKVSGSLSAFYNDYDHLRSLNAVPGTSAVTFENHLRAHTGGFELSADYQALDWWRLHGGYDLLKEDFIIGPGGDLNQGRNEAADPQNQFFFRSSMDLPWHTKFDAALRWIDTVHNNSGPAPGAVPSYAELDVRLAWQVTKNLELSLVGQNLLHDHHPEAGFPNASQEAIQRSVYGKMSFRW
ncbi:TonB-dependent receptor plug [Verrucomicrobia bacterium]|nr:TonB-dependent receptor plug [Verrucomicrobiota bacterium]